MYLVVLESEVLAFHSLILASNETSWLRPQGLDKEGCIGLGAKNKNYFKKQYRCKGCKGHILLII